MRRGSGSANPWMVKNFTGVIDRTGEEAFVLRLSEGAEVELPFGSVTRANLKEDIYK